MFANTLTGTCSTNTLVETTNKWCIYNISNLFNNQTHTFGMSLLLTDGISYEVRGLRDSSTLLNIAHFFRSQPAEHTRRTGSDDEIRVLNSPDLEIR